MVAIAALQHWRVAAHKHKPYQPDSDLLHWLHIIISNAKAFILATYHGLPKKKLHSYLDEHYLGFDVSF